MPRKQETVEADPIKMYLDTLNNCWYFKVHGSRWQMTGLPDFIGCYQGRFFGLEQKRDGVKPRANQRHRLTQIKQAGGIAAIVRSVEDVQVALGLRDAGPDTSPDLWQVEYVPIHKRAPAGRP